MSLKTFFAKLGGFFRRPGDYLRQIVKKAEPFMKKEIPLAIAIVENFKSFVNSPFGALLTTVIPGQVDDYVIQKAREVLPGLLVSLKLADNCSNMEDPDAVIQCALLRLQEMDPGARSGDYIKLAAFLAQAVLPDNELSFGEAIVAVQLAHDIMTKRQKEVLVNLSAQILK